MQRNGEFIGHRVAKARIERIEALLYEYVLCGNGVILRAQREEFSVSVPLVYRRIKGIPASFIGIRWHKPRVPQRLWAEICRHANLNNSKDTFKEELYLYVRGGPLNLYARSEAYACIRLFVALT